MPLSAARHSHRPLWVPPEETDPVLLHAPTHKSVALFGVVSLQGGQMISHFNDLFDAQNFPAFLPSLLCRRRRGKRMVIIVGNARCHHAAALADWLQAHRAVLELLQYALTRPLGA